jgi:hypothetical protein
MFADLETGSWIQKMFTHTKKCWWVLTIIFMDYKNTGSEICLRFLKNCWRISKECTSIQKKSWPFFKNKKNVRETEKKIKDSKMSTYTSWFKKLCTRCKICSAGFKKNILQFHKLFTILKHFYKNYYSHLEIWIDLEFWGYKKNQGIRTQRVASLSSAWHASTLEIRSRQIGLTRDMAAEDTLTCFQKKSKHAGQRTRASERNRGCRCRIGETTLKQWNPVIWAEPICRRGMRLRGDSRSCP